MEKSREKKERKRKEKERKKKERKKRKEKEGDWNGEGGEETTVKRGQEGGQPPPLTTRTTAVHCQSRRHRQNFVGKSHDLDSQVDSDSDHKNIIWNLV